MKKVLVLIFLLIEFMGLFAILAHLAKGSIKGFGYKVEIPEGMVLTTSREVYYEESDIVISEGTTVIPTEIKSNRIYISFEGEDRITCSWSDFVEQSQLNELLDEAYQRRLDENAPVIVRGIVIGFAIGICWIAAGAIVSHLILKMQKIKMLVIGHIVVCVLIFAATVFSSFGI